MTLDVYRSLTDKEFMSQFQLAADASPIINSAFQRLQRIIDGPPNAEAKARADCEEVKCPVCLAQVEIGWDIDDKTFYIEDNGK